jgi:sphinganine-1-phosphate aldolase
MPCAQADVAEVAKAINRNTVLLVASAPQYPHGVVDPIDAIGELAVAHRKPGC